MIHEVSNLDLAHVYVYVDTQQGSFQNVMPRVQKCWSSADLPLVPPVTQLK